MAPRLLKLLSKVTLSPFAMDHTKIILEPPVLSFNKGKVVPTASLAPMLHPVIHDQNPYRAEIGGIFAIVVVVEALAQVYDIQHGTIELGCDCTSGLTAVFEHEYDSPSQPHHNLIHEIRKKLSISPITWKFRHVRGHQDKTIPFHMLDLWSQLNVEMDSLAKTFWNQTQSTVAPFYPTNSFGWSLWIGKRKLSTWDRTAFYDHVNSTDILDHWSQRRAIPSHLIQSIDWEAGADAIRKLGLNQALWIPKWLAGFSLGRSSNDVSSRHTLNASVVPPSKIRLM
jgi:hypothetical protein